MSLCFYSILIWIKIWKKRTWIGDYSSCLKLWKHKVAATKHPRIFRYLCYKTVRLNVRDHLGCAIRTPIFIFIYKRERRKLNKKKEKKKKKKTVFGGKRHIFSNFISQSMWNSVMDS